MIKRTTLIALSLLLVSTLQARISMFAYPAEYGIGPDMENWYEISTHTWDVFTSMDADAIFGLNDKRSTVFQTEFYSTGVIEGRKVGSETLCASFSDRGGFFGGEGYMDLYYFAPIDESKYAQQAVFYGGWKYNLNKYLHIDLGGTFTYATKRVIGPGIAGYGGETFRDDFYVGFCIDKLYLNPFVYFDYCSEFDAKKYMAGVKPRLDLYPYTKIEGLSFVAELTFGYIDAQRFSGDYKIDGSYWKNSYAYIQAELNLVYQIESVRLFVGMGWACHNDGKGKVGKGGVDMGQDQMIWGSCGIGYVF